MLIIMFFVFINAGLITLTYGAEKNGAMNDFNTFRDVIIPLANMGVGAVIAFLLIWQIFPILNRNTETLKEIAATLDVISNNNLRLAEKLLDIIEKQSLKGR